LTVISIIKLPIQNPRSKNKAINRDEGDERDGVKQIPDSRFQIPEEICLWFLELG
jgi:hypothetical protein